MSKCLLDALDKIEQRNTKQDAKKPPKDTKAGQKDSSSEKPHGT